jgi:deoxyadenosine/deoxycytidine kinase
MIPQQSNSTFNRPRTFVVEGNIGAGKSTFLRILKEKLNLHVVYEPLHKWKNVGGSSENILEKFYSDTTRWAYTFQTYTFVTRILEQEEHARIFSAPIHILERSVFSDRYCFAKNGFELGLMNTLEWQMYQEWFAWLVDQYVTLPDGFIYMRTDPSTCHRRLKKRARHEEAAVSLDYLGLLHKKHEDWLIERNEVAPAIATTPVLTVPCDAEFQTCPAEQERLVAAVAEFIGYLQMPVHATLAKETAY